MIERMIEGVQEVINTLLAVEKRILATVNNRVANVEERLIPLERKVNNIEEIVLDTREDLDAGLKAIDRQALKLFDHDKRIGRLEKKAA